MKHQKFFDFDFLTQLVVRLIMCYPQESFYWPKLLRVPDTYHVKLRSFLKLTPHAGASFTVTTKIYLIILQGKLDSQHVLCWFPYLNSEYNKR